VGFRANNDPSEGTFAMLTDILRNDRKICLANAGAVGQMQHNKDMSRDHELLGSGKHKKTHTAKNNVLVTFHQFFETLQDYLIAA
jgi:hypothetical protein